MKEFAIKIMQAKSGTTHLFSLGQAGYILKSKGGQLLGVDLYLSKCAEKIQNDMGFKRLFPSMLDPLEIVFDGILATHSHFDHFDIEAIPKLISNPKTKLYASVNCKQEIKKLHIINERITYIQPGDQCKMGDYMLEFVSCDHGAAAVDAVGVVITVDGKKIYITGDTCLRLDRVDEYREKGPFDIMIAPINGAFGNMNEEECAALSKALKPQITIPSHYGLFAAHGGNPGLFIDIMNEKCPENGYYLMALGEGITI